MSSHCLDIRNRALNKSKPSTAERENKHTDIYKRRVLRWTTWTYRFCSWKSSNVSHFMSFGVIISDSGESVWGLLSGSLGGGLCAFWRWGSWGSESLEKLSKITEPGSGKLEIGTRASRNLESRVSCCCLIKKVASFRKPQVLANTRHTGPGGTLGRRKFDVNYKTPFLTTVTWWSWAGHKENEALAVQLGWMGQIYIRKMVSWGAEWALQRLCYSYSTCFIHPGNVCPVLQQHFIEFH